MPTIRLTMAQALVRFLAAQRTICDGREVPLFGGVWAIFGHGNVTSLGEALYGHRALLPTYRAHNEQAMAHAAIAFAKAHFRRRMMACTTSIGPGATNLITAAATAHVNRLPVLLLPGDVYVSRDPDPVLQQVEDFQDGGISANDCLKPVSRYFDRILAPSQLLTALPRAIAVLTDPAQCGPVTLALPQDVQAQAYDFPAEFFAPTLVRVRAPQPEAIELDAAATLLRGAKQPMLIAGGGVLYSDGGAGALRRFAEAHRVPVTETQAGKSALPWDHPLQAGAIGVTGSTAANELARNADLVIAVGTRLSDFTTGSHSLFAQARLVAINVNAFDALKWRAATVHGDAAAALDALSARAGRLDRRRRMAGEGGAGSRGVARDGVGDRRRSRGRATEAPVRRRGDRRGPALAPAIGGARHRRLRGGHAARRAAQALARRRGPAATTWSTATPAWATRSPAASASRWRIRSARSS